MILRSISISPQFQSYNMIPFLPIALVTPFILGCKIRNLIGKEQ